VRVYIFVWEKKDWSLCKGYVTSPIKAEQVRDVLCKSEEVNWFEEFSVGGYIFELSGIKNIELKGGEIVVKR